MSDSNNMSNDEDYSVRSKIISIDKNGTVRCFDKKTRKELKNHKYSIVKDRNGNNKYIIKKDNKNYYRYSLNDGHLIDSINHKSIGKGFLYKVYSKNKLFKKIDLGFADNIEDTIKKVKQEKIEPIGLRSGNKREKYIAEFFGFYPAGNSCDFFYDQFYEEIKQLCLEKNILEKHEKNCNYDLEILLEGLEPLAAEEGCSKEKYVLRYIANKYKEYIEMFNNIEGHELFARKTVNTKNKNSLVINLGVKNLENNEITIFQAYGFDEQNEFKIGRDSKGKLCIKIGDEIAGKNSNNEEYGYRYYFVKPVGQPMYLFKKEKKEFSNHSNFPESEHNPERLIEAAGSLTIKNGKITNISNSSGHFQPGTDTIDIALEYIASKCPDCDIRKVIDPKFKPLNQGYRIISDVAKTFESPEVKNKSKQWFQVIEDVAEELPNSRILKINSKAARKAAKNGRTLT